MDHDYHSTPPRENHARVYVPVDFDIKKCLPPDLWKYEDDARYIIGQIRWQQLMRFPHDLRKTRNPGVELKARYLCSILRCKDQYAALVRALCDSGAITCDRHYIEGRKCFTYNLGSLFSTEFRAYTLTDTYLRKNILRWRQREVAELTSLHAWLRSKLFLLGIRDREAITTVANDKYAHLFIPQVEAIRDKAPIRYHQDSYGRVHTNLTNIPKRLRQFLLVEGSSLCEIDLPNSQPLFFGITLLAPDHKCSSERQNHNPDLTKLLDQLIQTTPPTNHTPLRSGIIKEIEDGDYIKDVSQGRFYEQVAANAGMEREVVKRHVVRYLYRNDVLWGKKGKILRTQYPERAKVFDAIEELYPEIIHHLKAGKMGDYRRLAHNMQRAESYFIFQMVCERLRRERPGMFVATIHDSLLVTPGDVDYAYAVMMGEMASLGMELKGLKVKRY